MNRVADPPARSPFSSSGETPGKTRNLPVLTASVTTSSDLSPGDPMDVTTPTSATPQGRSSPENGDQGGTNNANGSSETGNLNNPLNQTLGAAAAAQQPKVVQTAFIHKLYKCVSRIVTWIFEDPTG